MQKKGQLQTHFEFTDYLARSLDPNDIANWLINEGFYPEPYVLPPVYQALYNSIGVCPYYEPDSKNKKLCYLKSGFKLRIFEIPFTQKLNREMGVFHPRIYHDLAWYITENWSQICDVLFGGSRKIYSYSFPIPLDKQMPGGIGSLRAGRMIYEFIEMAESDLLIDGTGYKYIVHTDIKNFYPSIYTHSIPWALHGKEKIKTIWVFSEIKLIVLSFEEMMIVQKVFL